MAIDIAKQIKENEKVRLKPEDVPKTAFRYASGAVLTFGLTSAPGLQPKFDLQSLILEHIVASRTERFSVLCTCMMLSLRMQMDSLCYPERSANRC
ncbi:hypothetical protein ABBQ38_014985 [Trebouxia sp. C0009 RCD-2024]